MIVVNLKNGLRFESNDKTFVSDTIGYSRVQLWRWSKRYAKKDAKDINGNLAFTVYFDKDLYEEENIMKIKIVSVSDASKEINQMIKDIN